MQTFEDDVEIGSGFDGTIEVGIGEIRVVYERAVGFRKGPETQESLDRKAMEDIGDYIHGNLRHFLQWVWGV